MLDTLAADGSAAADRRDVVLVDREAEPFRWRCPNGHTVWDRTNNHLWCQSCRRALEADHPRVDRAEHHEIVDARTGETVPYAAVEFPDK